MIKNYSYALFFILIVIVFNALININTSNQLLDIFYNGLCSVGFSLLVGILVIIIDKNFREFVINFLKKKRV